MSKPAAASRSTQYSVVCIMNTSERLPEQTRMRIEPTTTVVAAWDPCKNSSGSGA